MAKLAVLGTCEERFRIGFFFVHFTSAIIQGWLFIWSRVKLQGWLLLYRDDEVKEVPSEGVEHQYSAKKRLAV